MKKLLTLRKRKLMMTLSVFLALFAGMTSPVSAQETLTVYDGTTTNQYVPVYGYYGDVVGTVSEFIVPSSDISDMAGGTITAIKFYASGDVSWGTFDVYVKEVDYATETTLTGKSTSTVVYTGKLVVSSKEMGIIFSTPYEYGGGNLLIGTEVTEKGSYTRGYFYGTNGLQAGSSAYKGGYSVLTQGFIPKTTFTYTPINIAGPALSIYEDSKKLVSGAICDFGLTMGGITKQFTLKNPGSADLDISVSETGSFGATLSETTIPARGEVKLTVTVPSTVGDNSSLVTITPASGSGIKPFTINLTATVTDPSKMFEDFSGAALPDDWKETHYNGTYKWSFVAQSNDENHKGYASNNGYNSNYVGTLTTPKMKFIAGEKLYFETAKLNNTSSYTPSIAVQTSVDGNTWTDVVTYTDDVYGTWKQRCITISSADVCYVRFRGWYINLTNIYGGEIRQEPILELPETSFAYRFISEDKANMFTIKNTGRADMLGITVTSDNEAFVVSEVPTTLGPKNEGSFVVTMKASNIGVQTATITVKADGLDAKKISVDGAVKDNTKAFFDFEDKTIPDEWESVNGSSYSTWSFNNGYASYSGSSSSYAGTLTSSKLTFAAGEKVFFETTKSGSSSYTNPSVTFQTSVDGTTWTDVVTFDDDEYGVWKLRCITISSADVKYYRFYGWYFAVDNINGGELPQEPNIKFTPSDYEFGMITAETTSSDFTIVNKGGAALNNLSVTSSNANFTVAVADNATSIAANSNVTFNVTMKTTVKGQMQTGVITVSGDGMENVTFNVSGYVADTDLFYEDFSGNALPDGWEVENKASSTYWSISGGTANGSYSSNKSYLITPALTVAEGESMVFMAKYTSGNTTLRITMSKDGGEYVTCKNISSNESSSTNSDEVLTSEFKLFSINGLEPGSYRFRFESETVALDNFNGFHLDQNAPKMIVTKGTTVLSATSTLAFGRVKEAKTQAYKITNSGTGTLTGSITTSDATQFTVSPTTFSLAAGESTDFTVSLVFDENYGSKTATITVTPDYNTAEAIVINATATTADPNVWDEDFESGSIPAYWVSDGWTVSQPYSYVGGNGTYMAGPNANDKGSLITPRLQATKDQQLSFYVYAESATYFLKAEYSNDDKATWTEIETYTDAGTKTFAAPEDGFYYIRFTGYYTYLDNLSGFKLALKEHDATITAKNIPSSKTKYATYTATVTVKELVGKDEELTAKFFIGNTQYGDAVTKTVSANASETFTVSFEMPATAISGEAYFTVANEYISLTSDKVAVTINEPLTFDETATTLPEYSTDYYDYNDVVVLNYTAKSGWNTISVPFQLDEEALSAIFGEGWKAYVFSCYSENELKFETTTSFYAGYPYIVYVPVAATHEDGVVFKTIKTPASSGKSDERSGAKFQGTFTPMAEGTLAGKYGVTPDGKIRKGGANATMPGFRGYFELPADAPAPTLSFTDENGETTYIRGIEAEQILKGAYNLQGQPVDTPTKGVYIINGKKVVIK